MNRRHFLASAAALTALPASARAQEAEAEAMQAAARGAFPGWVAETEAAARGAGVSQGVMDAARAGLEFNADLVKPAGAAAESRRVGQYIDTLIDREGPIAQEKAAEHPQLSLVEAAHGVPASVLVAFWGRESAYGRFLGSYDVFSTLATRGAARLGRTDWRAEYVAALKMLERDFRPRQLMVGSPSGAVGHTQLMPSNVLIFGEDFDGDGRIDLWGASPLDAMASAARHIQEAPAAAAPPAHTPWTAGQSWIMPVALPPGFDLASIEVDETRLTPAEWRERGVAPLYEDWRAADAGLDAKLALPAGVTGPALLLPPNYDVFEAYNPSRAYALAVALLARHIEGGTPVGWPTEDPLPLEDRQRAQRGLAAQGLYDGPIDGDIGSGSRAAIRAWQRANGRAPDGYLSVSAAAEIGAAAPPD